MNKKEQWFAPRLEKFKTLFNLCSANLKRSWIIEYVILYHFRKVMKKIHSLKQSWIIHFFALLVNWRQINKRQCLYSAGEPSQSQERLAVEKSKKKIMLASNDLRNNLKQLNTFNIEFQKESITYLLRNDQKAWGHFMSTKQCSINKQQLAHGLGGLAGRRIFTQPEMKVLKVNWCLSTVLRSELSEQWVRDGDRRERQDMGRETGRGESVTSRGW